jgi:hypothetical protein
MKTTDGGLHWQEISPDLTGASQRGCIYTIAPSPLAAGQIWVGSDTGLVHLTRDGGKTWSDVTPPGLSEWSKITHIEASHFDAATAYAAIDRHRLDDYRPHLFRTRDFGKTWTEITQGMAEPAFLNAIREDPVRRGLLFAATELGVRISFDDGDHWQPLQFNLPAVSVRDLVIHGDDLVIATHGRSFWIMDDIAALRQVNAKVAQSNAWLYHPAIAIRTSSDFFQGTPLPPEIPKAPNPPDGAIIDYYLAAPAEQVTLEFLDAQGKVVRRYSSTDAPAAPRQRSRAIADIWIPPELHVTSRAGMNRFVWDLRYPTSGRAGPQVVPGTYEVRLRTGGQTYSQKLEVRLDPRSTASTAELRNQLDLALASSGLLDRTSEILKQIAAAPHLLPGEPTLGADLDKIQAALGKINGNISSVLEVVESADREPPAQAMNIFQEARQQVEVQLSRWNELKSKLPN